MKTILYIATVLPYDKLESNNIILEIAKRITGNNYFIKLVCPIPYSNRLLGLVSKKWSDYSRLPDSVTVDKHEISGVKGINFPIGLFKIVSSISFVILNLRQLRNLIKGVNLVHAHYILPDGFIAYYLNRRYHVPYIVTARGFHSKGLGFTRYIEKKILMSAESVLSVSYHVMEKMQKIFAHDITVIPHGIDKKLFEYTPVFEHNRKIRIISVARLVKYKNIDLVIKALHELNKRGYADRYEYTVVGEGEERDNLIDLAGKMDVRATFKGKMDYEHVQAELRGSDIFVLPSYIESFGIVYLEAMANCNAVIGVKDSGVYGLFKENEEILISDLSFEGLAEKIGLLLESPHEIERLKRNGREAARARFTWDAIKQQYLKVYDQAVR